MPTSSRARGGVSPATTALVNVWERLLDLAALALIAGVLGAAAGDVGLAAACLAGVFATSVGRRCDWRLLAAVDQDRQSHRCVVQPPRDRAGRQDWRARGRGPRRSSASLAAWVLPAIGFWILVVTWGVSFAAWRAVHAYAASTLLAALTLSPGGVVVTGERLLGDLAGAGVAAGSGGAPGARHPAGDGRSGDRSRSASSVLIHLRTRPRRLRRATSISSPTPTTFRFPRRVGRRCSLARRR